MAAQEFPVTGGVTADEIATRIDRLPFLPFHLRIASILGCGTLFDAFDSLSMGAALTMIVATFKLDYRSSGALISAAFGWPVRRRHRVRLYRRAHRPQMGLRHRADDLRHLLARRGAGAERQPDHRRARHPGRGIGRRGSGRGGALRRVRARQRARAFPPRLRERLHLGHLPRAGGRARLLCGVRSGARLARAVRASAASR